MKHFMLEKRKMRWIMVPIKCWCSKTQLVAPVVLLPETWSSLVLTYKGEIIIGHIYTQSSKSWCRSLCAGVFWIPAKAWVGYTAGVLEEWWNKREEEVEKRGIRQRGDTDKNDRDGTSERSGETTEGISNRARKMCFLLFCPWSLFFLLFSVSHMLSTLLINTQW